MTWLRLPISYKNMPLVLASSIPSSPIVPHRRCLRVQPSYDVLSYAPICNLAVLALALFSLFVHWRRRWSVNLAGAAVVAAMVVSTTSLLLSGFTQHVVTPPTVDRGSMSREYLDEGPGTAALALVWGAGRVNR